MLIGFPLSSGTNLKYFQIVDLVFGLSMSKTSDNSNGTSPFSFPEIIYHTIVNFRIIRLAILLSYLSCLLNIVILPSTRCTYPQCLYDQLDSWLATGFLTFYCDPYSLFKFLSFYIF